MELGNKSSCVTPEKRALVALQLSRTKRHSTSRKVMSLSQVRPDPGNRCEPFPLSDIQQAYLIGRSEGAELGSISCQSYWEVEVTNWDHERFEAALHKMVERHEMLRCVVLPDGRQQILPKVPPYRVESTDLRGQEPLAAGAQLEAVRRQMSQQVRSTDRWPLFDFRISHLHSRRSRLHVSIDLLIADGRSLQILFSELAQLYHNPDAILPPLELSFRDYVLAFNSLEDTHAYRESKEYWLKRLPTLPPAPELPLARNSTSIARPIFKRRQARIQAPIWGRLKERSARLRLTPAGTLLAAYAEVLGVWSKDPRFTINLTLFNRLPLHAQANAIIGDFTSVNLLEIDNSKPETFEARASRVQEQLWQDLDRRYFSGIQVVRELSRSKGGGPKAIMPVVFTSLLNLGDRDADEQVGAGQIGKIVFAITQTPQVYLDFMVHEEKGELVINWDAVDELFPLGLLDDLFNAYRCLLEQLASDDSSWQRTLAENSRRLIPVTQLDLREEVNNTGTPLSDELLHSLFIKHVEKNPEQTALCTPTCRLSYAELYQRACRVEEQLLHRGVEPNQLVAVMMEKGWEQVAAVLGIHFAGGAYLPIDPELPPERQSHLIRHGEVKIVLTQSAARQRLTVPAGVEVIAVDLLNPGAARAPVPRRRQEPEDLAYVIYTSGSTGLPKGVMIDHRGAVNTVLDINHRFGIGSQDRVLAISRLSFDLSVYDIFGLLAAGGTIVMPSADRTHDPAHWAELIASEKVTVWNTVPALMQLLVEQTECPGAIGDSLRLIMMSGDWIPLNLPVQIREILPNAKIVSLGGATEASIWSISYPIEQVDPNWKSIPYGKPMLNQTFHVLNQMQAPCPVWVPGQLHIGGIGLAKGYWRDEQKTNASFIQHGATGQRLYRTGDWGRYLPDGNIEFLGREDSQVKLNGYRIELGEIEVRLQEHDRVDKCVVAIREDTPEQKRLVAYATAKQGVRWEAADLQEHLRAKLPEYMVPSVFVFLDRFPLTPNGKVDRRALPAPAQNDPTMESAPTAPRDALELQLTNILERILRIRPVGLRDNFFDLGGQSLIAVRLFSELRELTGRNLPLSAFFQAPTVEKLANLLRADG